MRGPILDALRASPEVRNVRVRTYAVDAELSCLTFAIPSEAHAGGVA